MRKYLRSFLTAAVLSLMAAHPAFSQPKEPAKAPPVEKLGDNLFRVGKIRVDTAKKEINLPGRVNDATVLEFVANTVGGFKAYESAVTLDTDAVTFNLALILIGLDRAGAEPSKFHFDPAPPKGDPVDIFVEWRDPRGANRIRAEELVYNKMSQKTLPESSWVYTGSVFMDDGQYLAERDGVLIGFVHTPASIIEFPATAGVGNYGAFVINPQFKLVKGMPVTITVRALPKNQK